MTQQQQYQDIDAHGSAVGEARPVPFATRPTLQGTFGMVAAGFALSLIKPQSVGIGGEGPILIHLRKEQKSVAINGQGWAPRAATIDWFRQRGITLIPSDGFLPATVPAQFAAWFQPCQP